MSKNERSKGGEGFSEREGKGRQSPSETDWPGICFKQSQWHCARSVLLLKKAPLITGEM